MQRAQSKFGYPCIAFALIGLALALRWPILRSGFAVDDYAQQAMMRGEFPLPRAALKLFTFSSGGSDENLQLKAVGFFPWWSDAQLKVSLFRPLSSALMWFDLKNFGDDAYRYHLHNAAWWLLMMAVLACFLRHVLQPWPACLALALCCSLSAHGMFLGWIANRNACVCSAFALVGLLVCLRYGFEAMLARGLAIACFALGLSAGEYALGFLGYPVALAWYSARSPRQRVAWTVPWIALLAIYLTTRAVLGFGTHGSGMYIDPFGEPFAFLNAALVRAPISVGEIVTGIQANWWSAGFPWARTFADAHLVPAAWAEDLPGFQHAQVAIGILAAAFALSIGVGTWRRREHRWLVVASLFAFLPPLASTSESRLLLPSFLGWSIMMASAVERQWIAARSQPFRSTGLVAILVLQLFLPPFSTWPMIHGMPALSRAVRGSLLDPKLDQLIAQRRVLLLSAADATTTIYLPMVRRVHHRPVPRSCLLLSSSAVEQRLLRTDSNSFTLERLRTSLTPLDIYATAFRREALHDGQAFEADGMSVRVERTVDGRAMRARYELDVSLDSPDVVLLHQTATGLQPLRFPPVGESTIVGPPIPPFAFDANATDIGI